MPVPAIQNSIDVLGILYARNLMSDVSRHIILDVVQKRFVADENTINIEQEKRLHLKKNVTCF